MTMKSTREATLQERITFLQDLHRPLEEHWCVNFGLNPRTSDYMYKHHITHLEDIYLNHKFDFPKPAVQIIQSPVTQLYGINGLKSTMPKQKEREKEKEGSWVSNFQKYQALSEPKRKRRQRIKPPTYKQQEKGRVSNVEYEPADQVEVSPLEVSEEELAAEQQLLMRRRTKNDGLTSDELVLLGMYHLNKEQEEVYQRFVAMISEFDKFDMRSIVEDAFEDAQSDGMLQEYGGTDTMPADQRKPTRASTS